VITGVAAGGMSKLWFAQNTGNSGVTYYGFNNVLYNNVAGNDVNLCQEGTSCGPLYIFNNTFNCGGSVCSGSYSGPTGNVYFINNHCILGSSGYCYSQSGWNLTITQTTSLVQTTATANADVSANYNQYTASQTYAFSPVAATNSTVLAGTNEQSLCTTISGINSAAGTACQYDTGYACSYNTSNHTLSCSDRAENARPQSGAWDIGAYLYNAGDPPPNPPTGLTAVVN
jgi:hypothetical protein